jgi:hypothetical protein
MSFILTCVDNLDSLETVTKPRTKVSIVLISGFVVEGDVFYPHASNIVDNLDSLERRIIFQLGLNVYYSDQT